MDRHCSKHQNQKIRAEKLNGNGISPMWTQIAGHCKNESFPHKYAVHKLEINQLIKLIILI